MSSQCSSNASISISFDALYRPGSEVPACQPQLEPVVDFSFTTLGCGSRMRRDQLRTSALFVTSTNYGSWTSSRAVGFKYTPLYTQLPSPLVFYHESSIIASSFPPPPPNATDLSTLCMVDLFDAWPSFARLITSNRSCIDAFYRIAGRQEPFEGVLRIPSGKVLSRKVAALYHASMGVDDGTPMMWLDWDTTYRPQSHDVISSFWQHVTAHDVTVLPFRHGDRTHMRCTNALISLDDPSHTIDTGLLGLRRGAASVRFLWRLMRHYDGGATYLRHICACCDQTTSTNGARALVRPLLEAQLTSSQPTKRSATSSHTVAAASLQRSVVQAQLVLRRPVCVDAARSLGTTCTEAGALWMVRHGSNACARNRPPTMYVARPTVDKCMRTRQRGDQLVRRTVDLSSLHRKLWRRRRPIHEGVSTESANAHRVVLTVWSASACRRGSSATV